MARGVHLTQCNHGIAASVLLAGFSALTLFTQCASESSDRPALVHQVDSGIDADGGATDERQRLLALSPATLPKSPADLSNRFADDPRAAALGKKFFFEKRFSGPLLDSSNNGPGEGLGYKGDTGKVGCVSCHIPSAGFSDSRSPRGQVSLGAGWTHRRAPSLLDVGQQKLLMWDGRRDAAYNQVFGPIESPLEFNSSRLYVAQKVFELYRAEYEAIFGVFPDISSFAILPAAKAGCDVLPEKFTDGCIKPSNDAVTQVVVNVGKAISAYLRTLSCGPSRFDQWMRGDESVLTASEKNGAKLFVGKAMCVSCHSGPTLSDQHFHNIGLPSATVALFLYVADDPGAVDGLSAALTDPLNVKGKFSDGDDGRLSTISSDIESYRGKFRTPGLRCVSRRPSFTHTGQLRSLEDVVHHFNTGGAQTGFVGTSEIHAMGLTSPEEDDVTAFLRALDGPGPSPDIIEAPVLP